MKSVSWFKSVSVSHNVERLYKSFVTTSLIDSQLLSCGEPGMLPHPNETTKNLSRLCNTTSDLWTGAALVVDEPSPKKKTLRFWDGGPIAKRHFLLCVVGNELRFVLIEV